MGRNPRFSKDGLKKGAWTTLEDEMLMDYVKIHGEGKWSNIVKETGLNRCGKSCRLRWMNYLRPNIKRGNISDDEEDLIIRLHKLLGNRWSLIAGRLPGRTDNEIKNYWHTNIAKKVQQSQFRRQPRVERKQVASGSQNGAASNLKKDDTNVESAGVVAPTTALQENNNIAQDHQDTITLAMATSKTYENELSNKDCNYMEDLCKFLDSDFPKLSEINGLVNSTGHHSNNTSKVDGDHHSVSINGCSTREIAEFPEKLSGAESSSNKCVQADQGFDFMSLISFLDSTDEQGTADVLGTNILP